MRYKLLGPSGLRVSELCLGTMSFGEAWGFGADEKEAHRILSAFADAGGNFIDTANKYHEGQSEEFVGSFLGPGRDRFVVATKYTLAMDPGDPNAAGNSRKNLRRSVEASLRRLRTDHLDLLWVHAWDYTTAVEEVMRGLDDLVAAGTVLHVALSDAPAWVASQANTLATWHGWSPLVALQVEYSLLERTADRELLPVAEAFGLPVCAWAPMGAGILTGKYTRGAAIPGGQPARRRQPGPPHLAGVRTLEQLEDVLGCLDVELAAEHLARLSDVSRIELGFPYELLQGPQGQLVYGDLEPRIELPPAAPIRWR